MNWRTWKVIWHAHYTKTTNTQSLCDFLQDMNWSVILLLLFCVYVYLFPFFFFSVCYLCVRHIVVGCWAYISMFCACLNTDKECDYKQAREVEKKRHFHNKIYKRVYFISSFATSGWLSFYFLVVIRHLKGKYLHFRYHRRRRCCHRHGLQFQEPDKTNHFLPASYHHH